MPWLTRFDSNLPEWVATFENLSLDQIEVGRGFRVRGIALTETLVLERQNGVIRAVIEGEICPACFLAYRDIAGPPSRVGTERTEWRVRTLNTLWGMLDVLDKESQSKFGDHIAPTLRNLFHSDDASVRQIVDETLHAPQKPRR